MASLKDLFTLRRELADLRQAHCQKRLDQLLTLLEAASYEHPYSNMRFLDFEDAIHKDLILGGNGLPASVEVGQTELIRVCAVSSLYNYVKADEHLVESGFDSKSMRPEQAYARVRDEYDRQGEWLNLRDFVHGNLGNAQGITWWTPAPEREELIKDELFYSLGLKRIPSFAVLLRAKIQGNFEDWARVPDSVDAFFQDVFLPTDFSQVPKTGVAIDLNDVKTLSEGSLEVVIKSIPTEWIEIRPYRADPPTRKLDSFALRTNLRRFYAGKLPPTSTRLIS